MAPIEPSAKSKSAHSTRVVREDRERVALAHAEREQAVRVALDALGRLGPRDLVPVVAVLDEVGRRPAAPARDRVAPEPRDRAFVLTRRTLWRKGSRPGKGESVRSLYT